MDEQDSRLYYKPYAAEMVAEKLASILEVRLTEI